MRKPIQICETQEIPGHAPSYTTALCDDGSIWRIDDRDEEWFRLPDVPGLEADSYYTPHFSNVDLVRIRKFLDKVDGDASGAAIAAGLEYRSDDDGNMWARLRGHVPDPVVQGETPEGGPPSIEEDAKLFRYWMDQATAYPGRVANALSGCAWDDDYRQALRKMMREDEEQSPS